MVYLIVESCSLQVELLEFDVISSRVFVRFILSSNVFPVLLKINLLNCFSHVIIWALKSIAYCSLSSCHVIVVWTSIHYCAILSYGTSYWPTSYNALRLEPEISTRFSIVPWYPLTFRSSNGTHLIFLKHFYLVIRDSVLNVGLSSFFLCLSNLLQLWHFICYFSRSLVQ